MDSFSFCNAANADIFRLLFLRIADLHPSLKNGDQHKEIEFDVSAISVRYDSRILFMI